MGPLAFRESAALSGTQAACRDQADAQQDHCRGSETEERSGGERAGGTDDQRRSEAASDHQRCESRSGQS